MLGSWHQWLLVVHIFFSVVWVGGILFIGWGVSPAAKDLLPQDRRSFFLALMQRTHRLFIMAGSGVIVSGLLLGTVTGPIHNWHAVWHTTFGLLWFLALTIASLTLFWGGFVSYRKSIALFADRIIWRKAESGDENILSKSFKNLAIIEAVETVGFIALIVIMVFL